MNQEEKIKKLKYNILELLDTLNVAKQLSEVKNVVTSEGQMIYDGVANQLMKGSLNMATLNNVISKTLSSNDINIKRFGESLLNKVNESKYKNTLLLIAESVYTNNAMMQLEYNKVFLNDLYDLCESSEQVIEEKILNGKLDKYTFNKVIKNIVETVKSKIVRNISNNTTHKTFVPVSYVYVNENNEHVFSIGNKLYSYDSKKINYFYNVNEEHKLPISIFARTPYNYTENCFVVNSILGNVYIYTEGDKVGTIVLNDGKTLTKQQYIESVSKAYNYSSINMLSVSNKSKYNDDDALVVLEHINDVQRLDNIVVVENLKSKEQFAFITNENRNVFCIDILRSNKYKNEMLTFLNPKQCKQHFEHITFGYDITKHITESINKYDIYDKKVQRNISELNKLLNTISENMKIVDNKAKIAESENDTDTMSELYQMRCDLQTIYNMNKNLLSSFVN